MIKCVYCGRENPDGTQSCSGCGCSPTHGPNGPQAPGTFKASGSILAGLIGIGGVLAGHPLSAFHILRALAAEAEPDDDSPEGLLSQAAALEKTNMLFALVLYQHIAHTFPSTPAGQKAIRTFRKLKAAHPDLHPEEYRYEPSQSE